MNSLLASAVLFAAADPDPGPEPIPPRNAIMIATALVMGSAATHLCPPTAGIPIGEIPVSVSKDPKEKP